MPLLECHPVFEAVRRVAKARMNWADYLIILIIVVSALISLWRGFLREVVSLITWIVAFWVALRFASQVGDAFKVIQNPSVRMIVGFVILFVVILIIGMLINLVLGKLMAHTGASASDRTLGVIFGLVRGVVIVAVLVIVAGFTTLPKDHWWRESRLIPYAQGAAGWMRALLPQPVADEMMSGLKSVAEPRHKP
ncbi:MAG TPA: CvpA family protein [Gammaproteobacteria bacterium]|nr:CvpA family protein [Gammaproteobacteria bacterium]